MNIPDNLKILAERYGNKCMIEKILSNLSEEQKKDFELIGILPNRKGIVVLCNEEKLTLLNIQGGVQITVDEPKKKKSTRRNKNG